MSIGVYELITLGICGLIVLIGAGVTAVYFIRRDRD